MKNIFQPAAALGCLVLFFLTGCNTTPPVPDAVKAPSNESLVFTAMAIGAQVYRCDSIAPNKFDWVFKEPVADLFDANGVKIGRHYKSTGPTWELDGGSKVICKKVGEAPSTVSGAIPWYLLEATDHGGTGALSKVTHVQRLKTQGGVKPSDPCDRSTAGKEKSVPYIATYYFFQ